MPDHTALSPEHDEERGGVALLIIDMINRFDFEGGELLLDNARRIVPKILELRSTMDNIGAPTIYVNDNFGEWHSEKSKLVESAAECAPDVIAELAPRETDYFVIKAQLSGFYSSNLPILLPKLGASRLVLTGVAADICVLFTAADAHMRDYVIWTPSDAVASESETRKASALDLMSQHLGAEIAPISELNLSSWLSGLDEQGVR